jgi:hypothetical protein
MFGDKLEGSKGVKSAVDLWGKKQELNSVMGICGLFSFSFSAIQIALEGLF